MLKSSFSEQGARSGIPTFDGSPGFLFAGGCVRIWGAFLVVVVCFLSSLSSVHATLTVLAYHGMSAPAAPAVFAASNSNYVFNPAQVHALDRSLRVETVSGSSSGIAFRKGPVTLIPVPEGASLFPLIGIFSLALIGHHLMRNKESFRVFLKKVFRRQGSAL